LVVFFFRDPALEAVGMAWEKSSSGVGFAFGLNHVTSNAAEAAQRKFSSFKPCKESPVRSFTESSRKDSNEPGKYATAGGW
jgi:hypothetical protein